MITLIEKMNSIDIKFFAIYRDLVQVSQVEMFVIPGTSIGDLKNVLVEKYPLLEKHVETAIFSINREFCFDDDIIPDNAEIGIFPPVSGGLNEYDLYTELTEKPIDIERAIITVTDEFTGAVCTFTGIVRQYTTRGKDFSTSSLQYQAYSEMAQNKMQKIGVEIIEKFPEVRKVAIIQRIGDFPVKLRIFTFTSIAKHDKQSIIKTG